MADERDIREGGYQPATDPTGPPRPEPLPQGTAFHPATGMPLPADGPHVTSSGDEPEH